MRKKSDPAKTRRRNASLDEGAGSKRVKKATLNRDLSNSEVRTRTVLGVRGRKGKNKGGNIREKANQGGGNGKKRHSRFYRSETQEGVVGKREEGG